MTVTPHQLVLPIIGAKAQKPMHSARYPAPNDYRPIHASSYDSEDRAGTVKLFGQPRNKACQWVLKQLGSNTLGSLDQALLLSGRKLWPIGSSNAGIGQ